MNLGTRPDVSYAVNALSKRTKVATKTHLRLLKKVLSYLNQTKNLGILFKRNVELKISLMCDASWATGENRKSIYGYLVMTLVLLLDIERNKKVWLQ